jgi:hypothetical protein
VRRLTTVVALAATAGALGVPAATGDGGSLNYSSKLTAVKPAVKGLDLRVVDGDDALELRNGTGKNILVPGYEREPYLRFLVGGRVEVNVNSPAKYLNEERYGGVKIPAGVGPKAAPRWELVSSTGSYVWHEHRIHWMSTGTPPGVKDPASLTKVFDWAVPMSVGGDTVTAKGTLWWVPTGKKAQADALIAAAVAQEARDRKAGATQMTTVTKTVAAPPATEATIEAAPAAAAPTSGSGGGSALLWIVVGVLAAALAALGGYVLRLRRGNDPGRPAGEAW